MALQGVDVCPPHSLSMESSIPECAGRSSDINITHDAFKPYSHTTGDTIDSQYVDGVSLTCGQRPRKHIWTFAAAYSDARSYSQSTCPCTNMDTPNARVPPFIGQDYFCETGNRYIPA